MRNITMLALAAAMLIGAVAPTFAFDDKDKPQTGNGQVTVINGPSQPVPVTVTNSPTVTVGNTPTVTIGNSPTVTIGNTPTVTVGNNTSVTVTNEPTIHIAPNEQVTIGNGPSSPVPVVALDAAGAFQIQLNVGLGTGLTGVAIPAGKRLVIEFVTLQGDAAGGSGPVQPIVLLESFLNPSSSANYYLAVPESPLAPGQFYRSEQVKVYADVLSVGVGFSGYTPVQMGFGVSISGHLVSVP